MAYMIIAVKTDEIMGIRDTVEDASQYIRTLPHLPAPKKYQIIDIETSKVVLTTENR